MNWIGKWLRRILRLFVLIAIAAYIYDNYCHKHSFWEHQPVEWASDSGEINSNSIGEFDASSASAMLTTISKLPLFNVTIPSEMRFHVFSERQLETHAHNENIYDFLRENFSSYLHMRDEVINYHITKETSVNIGIYHGNELVGFIHGRPIDIVFNQNEHTVYYVEYLCVHRDYRSRNLASILISRYIQEMERITGRDDLWFLFKKDGQKHPFVSFFQSEYKILDLGEHRFNRPSISDSDVSISDEMKRIVYDEWVQYSSSFQFHRKMTFDEFASPVSTIWICGLDGIAIVCKTSQLYDPIRDTHDKVVDIEYLIPLSTPGEPLSTSGEQTSTLGEQTSTSGEPLSTPGEQTSTLGEPDNSGNSELLSMYPYTFADLVNYLKHQGIMYMTINDIGRHREILRRVEPTFEWKSANQFQYYAYNFKCPQLKSDEFYFTIN
jgi:ribosomal protein S18 acetylase RimI-like enzyme